MSRRISLLPIALAASLGACAHASAPPPPATTRAWTLPADRIDPSTSPCDDFYRHACGGWIDRTTIAPGKREADLSYDESRAANERAIEEILEGRGAGDEETRRLRTFFSACMDEPAALRRTPETLRPLLARIVAVESAGDLQDVVRMLHALGVSPFFDFSAQPDRTDPKRYRGEIHQAYLGVPASSSSEEQERYRAHVARVLALSGDDAPAAARLAADVVQIEKALAAHALSYGDRYDAKRSEHPMLLEEIRSRARQIDWNAYLAQAAYPPDRPLNVTSPAYLAALEEVLEHTSLPALKAYLRFDLLRSLWRSLTPELASEFMQQHDIAPVPPRRDACRVATIKAMGVSLSRQFVRRHVDLRTRQEAQTAAEGIRATIAGRLRDNPWLSAAARAATTDKLEQTDLKIGYPDEWPDAGAFPVDGERFLANVLAARTLQRQEAWRQARAPRRRASWEMWVSPNEAPGPAVARLTIPGAYPDAFSNSIVVSAAYLQAPLFDPSAPPEVHYGTFGSMFGHELVHVLEQHEFDRIGQPGELWTPADVAEQARRARCVVEQAETAHVHGEQTVGENIADLGGLPIAYHAMARELGSRVDERGPDGLTRAARFFYSYAHGRCVKQRPETERDTIEHDGHAPAAFRVNAPLSNMPEFAAAFHCAATAKMVRPAAARCSLW